MKNLVRYFLPALLLFSMNIVAQNSDSTLLTIDRIFDSGEFRAARFGPARWLADGSGYTTLEDSEDEPGRRDIVLYRPEKNEGEILVPRSQLIPPGDSISLSIANHAWSDDMEKLLIFTNTRRVWRRHTRGDYWVLNRKTGQLKKLGSSEAKPATLMFAKFSPDGKKVAYVRENNIYLENLEKGTISQLTKDGSETIINGTFDWVYEEELDLRDGFRWSPDGKKIAFWQLDASGVGIFYLINNTDSLYPKLIPVQYPKAGTTNSAAKIGVVEVGTGEIHWMDIPGDPRNHYLARMEWAANSRQVVIQQLNRLQNSIKLYLADAKSGAVENILSEQDTVWLDVVDDLTWIEKGKAFIWTSDRDGWRHVYRISRDGKKVECLTPGEFDVVSINRVDEKGGWLYFIASPDNPAQRYLYRSSLRKKEKPVRVTPEEYAGTNSYQISPDGKWAIHTHSSFNSPPRKFLVSLPEHRLIRTLVDNEELRKKLATLKPFKHEFYRIKLDDGMDLEAWEMRPGDFDPNRKYPVLFYVYGEPSGQTVRDSWRGRSTLWHWMLTQRGYVVISVDNRGTNAPRGRAFRKLMYRKVGILSSQDQAAAARKIMQRSYVDPQRIGVWGWSGGGSMSLNLIFRYPEIYKTAVAIAPVPNQRYYDTIYQERYMGLPEDNAEGYEQGSPITFAHQLQGNLLLIHGTGDDNVHYQGSEALINALIKANKQFRFMAYPNRTHGIYEGENTTRHLYTLLTNFLQEHLPAGPRPKGKTSSVFYKGNAQN